VTGIRVQAGLFNMSNLFFKLAFYFVPKRISQKHFII